MTAAFSYVLLLVFAVVRAGVPHNLVSKCKGGKSVHGQVFKNIDGEEVKMSKYKGSVVLVVNVATFCGYATQYIEMNALLEKTLKQKLEIIGFPCNQFSHMEPGLNKSEILNGLKHVRPGNGFVPKIDMMEKADVNGKNELPLFTILKDLCPSPRNAKYDKMKCTWNPITPRDIMWNFEKFVIDADGVPIFRYLPITTPSAIIDSLKEQSIL
ncbi:glutathione peroxidase [Octopus bimaculoides]|nr:glutathione peroxidase [Octopus bimaculoides]XP_052833415.1 glutathione peroxidase [Octopus bimaculoides]XP_052833422.1 glutathione peroxidase [Octopus bimaculoides]|eukprot:XP_014775161.1 PREDICTED: epididymal secretory glutathione peroxidase-like [Octopus bimaculoides]